jgi:FkbH-like protein
MSTSDRNIGGRGLLPEDDASAAQKPNEELARLLDSASNHDVPSADLCLKIARAQHRAGATRDAVAWLSRLSSSTDAFVPWQGAAGLLARLPQEDRRAGRRTARVWITGSYTTAQLAALLPLAGLPGRLNLTVAEGHYAQYRQDLLDPQSEMYAFNPDYVVLAVHEGAAELPELSADAAGDVAREVDRWCSLWTALCDRCDARVIQHTFAIRPETALGNLSAKLPGSRASMLQAVNLRLGELAGNAVLVDCDRLAGDIGKSSWFDDRYWARAKQAVALQAVPALARQTAAVIAAAAGVNRKCLVLDLDNTLWGGVVGEDGLSGIRVGGDAIGEAYVRLQTYILDLKRKGVILAVASKNDDADAKEVFQRHPDMRIRLDDIAVFLANWDAKVDNLRKVAERLNIGLDSLVLLDDNPAERRAVTEMLPEVDVIHLGTDPADYTRTLAQYPWFETESLTAEDTRRTEQYHARAKIADLQRTSGSLESFYRGLGMRATIGQFDDLRLPRIAQLVNKTNQFNLTTRRYDEQQLRRFSLSQDHIDLYLELRDHFADHGLVAVLIARHDGITLDIDSFLMSCRVIGRTVESALLHRLCREARERDCSQLRGTYVPSAKNAVVQELYGRLGFRREEGQARSSAWIYDLEAQGDIASDYIVEEVHA